MQVIRSITAYYPAFHLGCEPRAIECQLSEVEANGKRFTRTPFAFVESSHPDALESWFGFGFFATAQECDAYLAAEYPHWQTASPIMDALCSDRHYHGATCGHCRTADRCHLSTDAIYRAARGHKSFTLKAIRAAVALLTEGEANAR
jgi:hypothetical protein